MSNESVLIVEDTPINLKVVHFVMKRAGFDVRTATSAEEALEVLKHFRPRVVLTDIQLPGMDGFELIKRLKADINSGGTIVLALTAFAMKSDEQRAFDAGCDGFITKPIDTRTFPNLIRQYIAPSHEIPSKSVSTGAPEVTGFDFSLHKIQQAFIVEAIRQGEILISTLNAEFDDSAARIVAHRWVGAAGQIGYPEIACNARELETLLQQSDADAMARVREVIVRLMQLFSEAQEAGRHLPPAAATEELYSANRTDGRPA